jgi:hypothetical protein
LPCLYHSSWKRAPFALLLHSLLIQAFSALKAAVS